MGPRETNTAMEAAKMYEGRQADARKQRRGVLRGHPYRLLDMTDVAEPRVLLQLKGLVVEMFDAERDPEDARWALSTAARAATLDVGC